MLVTVVQFLSAMVSRKVMLTYCAPIIVEQTWVQL